MAIPSRIKDRAIVLSKLKQNDYATILTDANIAAGKRFAPNSGIFGQPEARALNDMEQSMKGHDYATRRDETEREYSEQLSFDGDTWLLALIAALAMGKVTTTQPNAGGNPTCYKHVIKPLDPATDGKDLPVTTPYIEAANVAGLKRRMHSCMVREYGYEFPPGGKVQVSCTLTGSGQYTSGALGSTGVPAMSTKNLIDCNSSQYLYGAQGGPTDITSEIVRGTFKFGFSWDPDDDNARHPGGGLYRSRAWVGRPLFNLEFARLMNDSDAAAFTEAEANTIREFKYIGTGAQIGAGPEKHQLEIRALAVMPKAPLRIGQQGDKSVWLYQFGPEDFLKEGANDVATVTVQNLESSYLV